MHWVLNIPPHGACMYMPMRHWVNILCSKSIWKISLPDHMTFSRLDVQEWGRHRLLMKQFITHFRSSLMVSVIMCSSQSLIMKHFIGHFRSGSMMNVIRGNLMTLHQISMPKRVIHAGTINSKVIIESSSSSDVYSHIISMRSQLMLQNPSSFMVLSFAVEGPRIILIFGVHGIVHF
uniref:Uncharacterized protein MANES_06G025700 n=1 Tax=Rhizophora mucronata TaxID=61149 RepID=A0A2P2JZV7_RHIMU